MEYVLIIFFLILGLSIGSFINVILFRLGKKDGIFLGRSSCLNCNNFLKWYDLIPILSFFIIRGRCRHCKYKVSKLYPIIETTTAISFVAYFYFRGLSGLGTLFELLVMSGFIAILFFDLLEFTIPDKIVLPLIIFSFFLSLMTPDFQARMITALTIGFLFAIIYLASQGRWMGLGDAKLVLLIGFVLSYPHGILAILISIWLAALVGMALILIKKATLKTALPLGTFMAAISIIFMIFENELQKITQTIF